MHNMATMRHCQRIAVNISQDFGEQLGAVLELRRVDEPAAMRPATSTVLVLNRCSRPVRAAKFALPLHGMVEIGLIEKYGPVLYRSCLAKMVLDPS